MKKAKEIGCAVFALAVMAAGGALGGERIVTPLGGDGWRLWLDRKAEYANDVLHLNPVDAGKIREGRSGWLTPVDAKSLSVADPTCGWSALFSKCVPWSEAKAAWRDSSLSLAVSVPGTVEEYFFDAISANRKGERESGDYRGVSWWGRKFAVPASAKGRRVALFFKEGVRQRAEVFVNRRLVGYEMVLQSPFEVDISDAVKYGGENELAVRITDANGNFSWGDYFWTKWGKYLFPISHGFGGIPGGIDLMVTDKVRIEDVFVRNKPKLRDIDATVEIANGSGRDANLSVVASIVENWAGNAPVATPKTLFSKEVGRVSVPAGGTQTLDFNAVVRDAKLWEIHDSHLYDMTVALKDAKGALVDRYSVRFGFRFLEAKGAGRDAQLWLNGRRVFILSAISWGYWPSNGMYPTPELARKHVESAVKLGMNMLNCHRSRGNHAILDAADEMGVMYYEEPGGHSSYRTKPGQNTAGLDHSVAHEICRQKLLRMVKDHRNHASLMIYNMVNEPGWEPDELAKEDMALAHLLDPTRLIVYGSGFMGIGRPEPRKLNMLPYSQTQNITGFTDVHNASASPGVYVDSNYSSPVAFARKERAETELFIWGEEGALAAPPQLELIESARKGKPNGWDGQQYGLWYEGYKSYLKKKRLTKNFPSITDLITSMGNVQYYEHGRLLENARIADGCEAYILNGYESMKDDNLSGCVDCYRNHKGDPELVSKYMKPLVMSVKARDKLGATGDVNSLDLWVLNEYALEAGTYGVKAFVKTPRGKVREIYSGSVKISGGEKFSDLAAEDVKVSFDDGPGYYRIAAVLSGKDGGRLAKGHDEMLAVDLKGGRIASKCAIVGGGPEYVKYAQSIGANLKPYDPAMGRLDGILLAPTDLGMKFRPVPAFNFRAKDGKTPGLNLDHFLGKKFETPVGERVSTAAIDFDLKSKLMPGYDIVGTSNFSVRWEGFVVSDHTGEIEFEYTCDDGARVWFGGELVVDKWTNGPRQTRTFKRNLVAGEKYALKIEAYQDGGDWLASFKWKLPLPDIKFDMADILRRVREDGTRLVLIEDAEGWLEKLRDAKAFPEYRVFHPHKTWVGHNLFVKDHPFFEGLPVNCAMNWEYQKLVVYDGPRHFGLVMDGEEALAGIVGVPLRGVATSVGIVPYGRGKIVFSSLDIAPNLASGDKSAVTPKRIFANILGWTGGSLQETSAFFSPGARSGGVKFQERFAPSEGFVNRVEKPLREEVCLNGRWDFQPVPVPKDWKEGKGVPPELRAPSPGGWDSVKIKIPSPWNVNDFCLRRGEGPDHRDFPSYPDSWRGVKMGWLRRRVSVPAGWAGRSIAVRFEAVAGECAVFANGKKVAENFDLFLPFEADVTDVARPGETFELLVGVRGQKLFEDHEGVGRRVIPAGSMWGSAIIGIWQDVTLVARPKLRIDNVFVRPLVSKGVLALDVTVANAGDAAASADLGAKVFEWISRAGTDVLSAPVPAWELGAERLAKGSGKVEVAAKSSRTATIEIPVAKGALRPWTPETPNLNSLVVSLSANGADVDRKVERFGWREWTINGGRYLLNGKPIQFRSDSWHFMGIPQMTRRYAWAWFKAIKEANGNAVRLHAQVYPSFYHDMADEMGICILDETANWASDGGPKFDRDIFWKNSIVHLERFIKRDRNHASVLGWSISNENKPVILHVFNRPDLMPLQEKAWEVWRDICRRLDPTRPWISSDGEEDGKGRLPVTMGHYGDDSSLKNWAGIGKPWGVGEASMAYYGTPQQVAERAGSERSYESALGRMEGLAKECYDIIAAQRANGASYSCVFNLAWYALKPLPFGKRDLTKAPSLEDGIVFGEYVEGVPGVQPERLGPYSSTFNPGYDSALPIWDAWPMYDAVRAAFAPDGPALSKWSIRPGKAAAEPPKPLHEYVDVVCVGEGPLKGVLDAQGVVFSKNVSEPTNALVFVDAGKPLKPETAAEVAALVAKGADAWVWGVTDASAGSVKPIVGEGLEVAKLVRSTFIPKDRPLVRGLFNSDFYFCELQRGDAARFTLGGEWVRFAEVEVEACRTDWREWNKKAEEMKTAAIVRTENECSAPLAVVASRRVGAATVRVQTLSDFANSEKGYKTLSRMLANAGVKCRTVVSDPAEAFFLRDGRIMFPSVTRERLRNVAPRKHALDFWVYSSRPLDDLLIEPDMPKLMLWMKARGSTLTIGGKKVKATRRTDREVEYNELPLQQGWNRLSIVVDGERWEFEAELRCGNKPDFLPTVRASLKPQE